MPIGHAFEHLGDIKNGFVMVENVGNLICPVMFDFGEKHRVAVISTTEGADKLLKYPDILLCRCSCYQIKQILLNVDFNIQKCITNIKKIRSDVKIFELSVKTSAGFDSWLDWLSSLK